LASNAKIVEWHGVIDVASRYHLRGATFTIWLPMERQPPSTAH
jgi:hypothetical protein